MTTAVPYDKDFKDFKAAMARKLLVQTCRMQSCERRDAHVLSERDPCMAAVHSRP
jgi:hypothetical protein